MSRISNIINWGLEQKCKELKEKGYSYEKIAKKLSRETDRIITTMCVFRYFNPQIKNKKTKTTEVEEKITNLFDNIDRCALVMVKREFVNDNVNKKMIPCNNKKIQNKEQIMSNVLHYTKDFSLKSLEKFRKTLDCPHKSHIEGSIDKIFNPKRLPIQDNKRFYIFVLTFLGEYPYNPDKERKRIKELKSKYPNAKVVELFYPIKIPHISPAEVVKDKKRITKKFIKDIEETIKDNLNNYICWGSNLGCQVLLNYSNRSNKGDTDIKIGTTNHQFFNIDYNNIEEGLAFAFMLGRGKFINAMKKKGYYN